MTRSASTTRGKVAAVAGTAVVAATAAVAAPTAGAAAASAPAPVTATYTCTGQNDTGVSFGTFPLTVDVTGTVPGRVRAGDRVRVRHFSITVHLPDAIAAGLLAFGATTIRGTFTSAPVTATGPGGTALGTVDAASGGMLTFPTTTVDPAGFSFTAPAGDGIRVGPFGPFGPFRPARPGTATFTQQGFAITVDSDQTTSEDTISCQNTAGTPFATARVTGRHHHRGR